MPRPGAVDDGEHSAQRRGGATRRTTGGFVLAFLLSCGGAGWVGTERDSAYRQRMTPLLESGGGNFGYDFRVSEVLICRTPEPINRVFTIRFRSAEQKQAFFANPDHLAIKKEFFDASVSSTTVISNYRLDQDPT